MLFKKTIIIIIIFFVTASFADTKKVVCMAEDKNLLNQSRKQTNAPQLMATQFLRHRQFLQSHLP